MTQINYDKYIEYYMEIEEILLIWNDLQNMMDFLSVVFMYFEILGTCRAPVNLKLI